MGSRFHARLYQRNSFEVIDYAYANPGESIQAGQTSDPPVRGMGSLGLLATGAAGIVAWRKRRSDAVN